MDGQKQQLSNRGICVVIPVFNNEKSIRDVVYQSLEQCSDVIVVNDGSTDSTGNILYSIEGITIVEYPKNKGKGYALKRGFKQALQMGFTYAITLDGDGQHYPTEIPKFLNANIQHPGSIIVGERDLNGVKRTKGSSFANKFSDFWFFLQTGQRLGDTQSGYRLYPLKKLYGLSLISARYEAELELLVFPSWHGVKIFTVPINVYYPPKEERVSHFRPVKDFMRIFVLNTILCILTIVYSIPVRVGRWIYNLVCHKS